MINPETLEWLHTVGQRALCRTQTLHTTYWLAGYCCEFGIQGDFVECGVFAGVQVAAMDRARKDFGDELQREIHALDTFDGIPDGTKEDGDVGKVLAGESRCTREQVIGHFEEWGCDLESIILHEGLIEDTAPALALGVESIALLRLDADLYSPTKRALKYLLPLVVPGGWIIVDDYSLPGCRQAVEEVCEPGKMAPLYWQVGQK
jgi:hypothetical protein